MKKQASFVRRLLELRAFLIINLVILFFLALGFGREYLRNASIQREIQALEQEKVALEVRNLEILELSQSIQSQFFLEKEGRTKHGLRKPGERLVVVEPSGTLAQETDTILLPGDVPEDTAEETNRIKNPTRWWYFFFNKPAYNALVEYELDS